MSNVQQIPGVAHDPMATIGGHGVLHDFYKRGSINIAVTQSEVANVLEDPNGIVVPRECRITL